MADTATVEALRATDLFSSLSNRALGKVADKCRRTTHAAGTEIASEGDSGVGFHIIVEGSADVIVHGTPRTVLGPGDYFGDIALIDGKPRSASVVAKTPLSTIALTSWAFSPILDSDIEVLKALLLKMCERLRAADAA